MDTKYLALDLVT